MQTRPGTRKPAFYWQALLIALPALLLAGLGLLFLRQDRLLAHVDATEQAAKIARELADSRLPAVFKLELGDLNDWRVPPRSRFSPTNDSLLRLAASPAPAIACLVNPAGELVYPPPRKILPESLDLSLEDLDDAQRQAWQASQKVLYSGNDPATAIAQLQALAALDLPAPLLAQANYELGVLWQDAGSFDNAMARFEKVLAQVPPRPGAGTLLPMYAAQRMLQMSSVVPPESSRAKELVALVAWHALFAPSAISLPSLKELSEPEAYLEMWQTHEKSRALHRRMVNLENPPSEKSNTANWQWEAWNNDQQWLLGTQPAAGNAFWLALPEGSVRMLTQKAVAAMDIPPYFQLQITIAGRELAATNNPFELLANSLAVAPEKRAPDGIFQVRVYLSDANALYARQRQRTRWLTAVIGASVLAVLAGLVAAWRAFHRQQELNEMKTNFVSSVSHELRAPIASVRLMAEELDDLGPNDPKKHKEYQRFIVQECRRLSGLVENVLDFSRHEQGRKQYEFEATDLAMLVRETTRVMQTNAAEREIELTVETQGEAEPVEADGQALQQVLVNLLDNAIKHSPPKSRIEVGAQFNATHAQFWVQDHGEGIPPEDHQKIFERFYRRGSEMRRKTQGVGLGLAIVKYVTEAHGGSVAVASTVGQGSRFTVTLPLRQPGNL